MPNVIFICSDESVVALEGESGRVIMNLAVDHGISGIDGDCGGSCSCATCHVHVDPEWFPMVGPPGEVELEMLEFDGNVSEYSRLSCQLRLTDALDGIVLKVVGR